jgi:RNA 2',3'-cyclic 3'-phosphodiesterase
MRLFVALEIPEAVRENLAAMRNGFSSVDSQVRWVPPQNFHVTLKFIGGVPKEKLERIIEALRRVSLVDPAEVCFRGLGWYLRAKAGVMLWAIIEDSKSLTALAASIDSRLASMGFAPENRSFMPHLTLARGSRDISDSSKIALRQIADKYKKHDFGSVTLEKFHLMESTTLPTGPIYSKVQSFLFPAAGN